MYLLYKVAADLKEYNSPGMEELKYSPELTKEIEEVIEKFDKPYLDEKNKRKPTVDTFRDSTRIDWYNISYGGGVHVLSEEFMREFTDKLEWKILGSPRQPLSEDFIRDFKNKVNWKGISLYQKLSEDFIKEFVHKVNWEYISLNQKLSEDFIGEFQDKVDWKYVSSNQKLSEDFIREFQDKVDWGEISEYQNLSEDFIRKFWGKIDLQRLLWNDKLSISKEFRKQLEDAQEAKDKEVDLAPKSGVDGLFESIADDHDISASTLKDDFYTSYYEEGPYDVFSTWFEMAKQRDPNTIKELEDGVLESEFHDDVADYALEELEWSGAELTDEVIEWKFQDDPNNLAEEIAEFIERDPYGNFS